MKSDVYPRQQRNAVTHIGHKQLAAVAVFTRAAGGLHRVSTALGWSVIGLIGTLGDKAYVVTPSGPCSMDKTTETVFVIKN